MLYTCQRSGSPKPVGYFPCWLQFSGWGDSGVAALPVWLLPDPLAPSRPQSWPMVRAVLQHKPLLHSHTARRGPWCPVLSLQYVFQCMHIGTSNANAQSRSLMLARKLNYSKTHYFCLVWFRLSQIENSLFQCRAR